MLGERDTHSLKVLLLIMARRIVVFPVKGRQWAFSMATSPKVAAQCMGPSFKELWRQSFRDAMYTRKSLEQCFTPLIQYLSSKMEEKWISIGKAKEGSFKKRAHSLGERLLSRIKPSETFLKSIPKAGTDLEIIFPSGLNPRLVRRRVRHIALSGEKIHARYMYGSFVCLPFTILFGLLPVPNAPLFWNLFRAYANWQALEGSRKLLQFVNDGSVLVPLNAAVAAEGDAKSLESCQLSLVLSPCEALDTLTHYEHEGDVLVLSDSSMACICERYCLDYSQTLKWRDFPEKKVGFWTSGRLVGGLWNPFVYMWGLHTSVALYMQSTIYVWAGNMVQLETSLTGKSIRAPANSGSLYQRGARRFQGFNHSKCPLVRVIKWYTWTIFVSGTLTHRLIRRPEHL